LLLLGDPDWIRTNDPQLRRLLLYPTELRDLNLAAKIEIYHSAARKNDFIRSNSLVLHENTPRMNSNHLPINDLKKYVGKICSQPFFGTFAAAPG
jgi:hypothetical protein